MREMTRSPEILTAPTVHCDRLVNSSAVGRLEWMAAQLRAAGAGRDDAGCVLWVERDGRVRLCGLERPAILGRDPTCRVVIFERGVAHRHCRIERTEFGACVTDLGAPDGTWVNGVRVPASGLPLRDGDLVELGSTPVMFVG